MNIASVIVDIPTQALDTPYSYAVPDEMLVGEGGRPAAVGCAVLVTLGYREAAGGQGGGYIRLSGINDAGNNIHAPWKQEAGDSG